MAKQRAKVMKPNFCMTTSEGEKPMAVGSIVDVEVNEDGSLPQHCVGKVMLLGSEDGKSLELGAGEGDDAGDEDEYVIGDKVMDEEGLKAYYKEQTGKNPGNKKPETLIKELNEA